MSSQQAERIYDSQKLDMLLHDIEKILKRYLGRNSEGLNEVMSLI